MPKHTNYSKIILSIISAGLTRGPWRLRPRLTLLGHRKFAPLVPHGNRSEAYLSYPSIRLELVYAQSGKFHS